MDKVEITSCGNNTRLNDRATTRIVVIEYFERIKGGTVCGELNFRLRGRYYRGDRVLFQANVWVEQ